MQCTPSLDQYGGAAAKAVCLPPTGINLTTFVYFAAVVIIVGVLLFFRGRS